MVELGSEFFLVLISRKEANNHIGGFM
jgi:hypothetical protein